MLDLDIDSTWSVERQKIVPVVAAECPASTDQQIFLARNYHKYPKTWQLQAKNMEKDSCDSCSLHILIPR